MKKGKIGIEKQGIKNRLYISRDIGDFIVFNDYLFPTPLINL